MFSFVVACTASDDFAGLCIHVFLFVLYGVCLLVGFCMFLLFCVCFVHFSLSMDCVVIIVCFVCACV